MLTISQALQLAIQHQQAGELSQAEDIYRQILTQDPTNAEAMQWLGALAIQVGKDEMAIELLQQSLALNPQSAEAFNTLGAALANLRQFDSAQQALRHAIALQPDYADPYANLGWVFNALGMFTESVAASRQALQLQPSSANTYNNLALALQQLGRLEEATLALQQVIALKPDFYEAYLNLGNILKDLGRHRDAIATYRQAVELQPDIAGGHCNLAIALMDCGEHAESLVEFERAIELDPHLAEAYSNFSILLLQLQRYDDSLSASRRAIELKPTLAVAHVCLGNAFREKGQLEEALAAYEQALIHQPTLAGIHLNIGNVCKDQGRIEQAIKAYRQAIELAPDSSFIWSNYLYTLSFCPGISAAENHAEHTRWRQQVCRDITPVSNFPRCDRTVDRRLRIGYVSPDLRKHVVGRNMLPLFREHDHAQFEIFAYPISVLSDDFTKLFQSYADVWRDGTGISNESLAQLIQSDQIDILVDLTLHMNGNRLPLFARKPAPIQVTFAGYPGTTGLTTIDYRLTDPYLDPPGLFDQYYSETSFRLADSFWCYDALEHQHRVQELPALRSGVVTFGCFNNFCKVSDATLRLWARVLKTVTNSRLKLIVPIGSARERMWIVLEQEGIRRDRIEMVWYLPQSQYLEQYHQIDIGLDTLPYNGHSTSLDSCWMGVPVVTLVGDTVVGRAGYCQLMNLQMPEWIANTPDEFVNIAATFAHDLPRLAKIREGMRERMENSPLMNAKRFARNIETAYRQMWQTFCQRS